MESTRNYTAEIVQFKTGNQILIEVPDELDMLTLTKHVAEGRRPEIGITINDGRHFSVEQRKKWFALLGDYMEYTGDGPIEVAADSIKLEYMIETGSEYFSWSDKSPMDMTQASQVLDWLIQYMFDNNIPWTLKTWDLLKGDYRWQMQALKRRLCVICGKEHAQVAHYRSVGMGGNRYRVDPTNYLYMSLCAEHHSQQHNMGLLSFMELYQVKPISLTADEIKEFRIRGTVQENEEKKNG